MDDILDIGSMSVSLEGTQLYEPYYRTRGLRRVNQLDSPIISDIANAILPKFSIYHYNPESPLLFGPLENNAWFKNDSSIRYVNHIFEMIPDPEGPVVKKPLAPNSLILAYRRKHRTLKLVRDFFGVNKLPNVLLIYNYCLINQMYKYRPHRFVNYFAFKNVYRTIIKTMDRLGDTSDRQQFFEIRMPKNIPSRQIYKQISSEYIKGNLNNRILNYFPDSDSFLLLHLYLWLSEHRPYSMFNALSQKNLKKINIILTDSGKYVMINLGLLDSWRAYQESLDEDGGDSLQEDFEGKQHGEKSERLIFRFYKTLMALISYRGTSSPDIVKVDAPTYTEDEINDTSVDLNEAEAEDNPDDGIQKAPQVYLPSDPVERDDSFSVDKLAKNTEMLITGKKPETLAEQHSLDKAGLTAKTKTKIPELPILDKDGNTVSEVGEDESLAGKPEVEIPEDVPPQVVIADDFDFDLSEDNAEPIIIEKKKKLSEDVYQNAALQEAMKLVENGYMTAKEYQRVQRQAERYKEIVNPYSGDETIEEFIKIDDKDVNEIEPIKVPDSDWIFDKSMLEATIEPFKKQYLKKVHRKDVVRSVLSIQKAGLLVTGMDREVHVDPANKFETLKIKVQPVGGSESTVNIRLPSIDPETGEMLVAGVRYIMKNQRNEKPIRKVGPSKVSLTTYYGKLHISKAERKTFNLENFIHTQVNAKIIDGEITESKYGNTFSSENDVPSIYGMVARRFKGFSVKNDLGEWTLFFDYEKRDSLVNQDQRKLVELEQGDFILVGKTKDNKYLLMDKEGDLKIHGSQLHLPDFSTFLGIKKEPPLEMAEVKVFSNNIPLGILLGYYLGLSNMCRMFGVRPRKYFRGQHAQVSSQEYAIKFADETWVFPKRNKVAQLALSGFTHYHKYIKDYPVSLFEEEDAYIAILRDAGIAVSIENEFKLMERMFIDDISKDLLKQMKEPTEFVPLLIRAIELLTTMKSGEEVNMDDMLIKGYQRISGHIYKQLVREIKANQNKRITSKSKFNLPPTHIMQTIMKDPAVVLVDDINPIQNLKEHEAVTFGGDGGRSSRSMVTRSRAYSKTDMGVISEATVDSQAVAINTFMSANPKLTSVYGNSKRLESKKDTASILSTSSLLGVDLLRDDPKRTLFTSIQNSHTVGIDRSTPQFVRTGYETVIAHRVDEKFALVAQDHGRVIEVDNNVIGIKYANGETVYKLIGLNYGVSVGNIINNTLISDLKVGDKVEKGDVIAFNPQHFVRDELNKSQVIYKNSVLAYTVFMESNDTEEDSSAISERISTMLEMNVTETRTITIPFENEILNLLKPGDMVEPETILCTLADGVLTTNSMFDEDDLKGLSQLTQSAPRAKHPGMITKVEILYFGEPSKENASSSVLKLIKEHDTQASKSAHFNDGLTSRQLKEAIRVDGNLIPNNHLVIKFYIDDKDAAGIGDKFVVSNQLKSVVARVMTGRNETKSGKPIDCIFGYQSISNRIVTSAETLGTSNTLLKLITQEVIDIYRKAYPKK